MAACRPNQGGTWSAQVFIPLVARTVKGVEKLGQVIKESGVPLADLEVPFKMCAAAAPGGLLFGLSLSVMCTLTRALLLGCACLDSARENVQLSTVSTMGANKSLLVGACLGSPTHRRRT